MTFEEAIPILHDLYNYYNDNDMDSYVGFDDEDNEAIKTAIKAIKQISTIEQIINNSLPKYEVNDKIKAIVDEWKADTYTDNFSYECMRKIAEVVAESEDKG